MPPILPASSSTPHPHPHPGTAGRLSALGRSPSAQLPGSVLWADFLEGGGVPVPGIVLAELVTGLGGNLALVRNANTTRHTHGTGASPAAVFNFPHRLD